uniref:Little elongation complex subunit 1 C-terminal domain-containing protein n=1 Tax=Gasterosteus aculeatus aculeatus TaxID=481459 RepID=G3NTI8_GASAC|nr:little elongation complex subunit 1 [Gasterosteus aculeatus aculeatus]
MMPGDSHCKTAAIAADATIGNCQNCPVLHQSLTEYVTSFLALKQKIAVSDETNRLQQQLEELQIRSVTLEKKTEDYESVQGELEKKTADYESIQAELEQKTTDYESVKAEAEKKTADYESIQAELEKKTADYRSVQAGLEKKTADYESIQAELEEKKDALKTYGQMSEEMDHLKQQTSRTMAEYKKLENQLKDVEERTEIMSLENALLKREKAAVENDLLRTQTTLRKSQAEADQVEKLVEENAKTTSIKDNLENKVGLLEDSVSKRNHLITQLTKDNILLQRNIDDLQVRLMKLERERCKEYRSASTQASTPEEPKVDKEKFQMLLQNLWTCIEPQQKLLLHVPESGSKRVPARSPQNRLQPHLSCTSRPASNQTGESNSYHMHANATVTPVTLSPRGQKASRQQASLQSTNTMKQADTPKKSKTSSKNNGEGSSADLSNSAVSVEKILASFQPILPCISPLPDLDTQIESMETTGCEKENHRKMSVDGVLHSQEESLLITTSARTRCLKSSKLTAKTKVDLPVVTARGVEPISNENNSRDSGRNELSGITEMKGTDGEETHLQKVMQIEQDPASVTLVSAPSPAGSPTSDITDFAEVDALRAESQEPPCSEKHSSNRVLSQSGNAFRKEEDDWSETKMEVETSLGDVSGTQAVTPCGGEFPRSEDETTLSEERGNVPLVSSPVTFPTFIDSVTNTEDGSETGKGPSDVTGSQAVTPGGGEFPSSKDETSLIAERGNERLVSSPVTFPTCIDSVANAEVTNREDGSETGKGPQDYCGLGEDSQAPTVFKPQEDRSCHSNDPAVPDDNSRSTSSSNVSVSSRNVEERLERDPSTKAPGEETWNKAQGAEVIDVAASPSEASGANRPPSPSEFPLLEIDDDDEESHAERESGNADVDTSSKKDDDPETLISEMLAGCEPLSSDPPETVSCESLEEGIHSACRRLSPLCLLPTLKLQAVPNLVEKRVIQTAKVKHQLQHSVAARNHKEMKYNLRSVRSAASVESASAKTGRENSLGSCVKVHDRPSAQVARAKGSSPEATKPQPPECIGQVRCEMGPPLPRLLTPLTTPPKAGKPINPRQAIGKLSFPSPMDGPALPATPVPAHSTPVNQHAGSSSLNSPLPPSGVPSSPLQFGSATPKHAVPVPGRLPAAAISSTVSSSPSSPSQENSMRILDTMYPELSAHGRTLSILRGNVGLSVGPPEEGGSPTTADGQASRFKTVSSTAFTETRGGKRPAPYLPPPKSSKCLRLDNCSPTASCAEVPSAAASSPNSGEEGTSPWMPSFARLKTEPNGAEAEEQNLIAKCLMKIENQAFDLMPVIRSHLHVGNLPKKPVLRDEEKEVISEICRNGTNQLDDVIFPILNKLKAEKSDGSRNYLQALCRVYTGICRQASDWEKAHILAYSLLTEDFPDSAKLILFMVTTWPNVLSHSSPLGQAIHAVTKLQAQEDTLSCLSRFLGWEKSPPCDIDELISRTVCDIRSGSSRSFTTHSRYGHDLGTEAWQNIFTLQLLCAHKKWQWTYNNLLSKELWPIMNTWVSQPREPQAPISDVAVATVLRLIGRLGQLGMKKRCVSSVLTVANVINTFGRHGHTEGVPWEVQLAAIYCIYDLSPCNPKQALGALADWRGETSRKVPPAVTSCMNQLASVCRAVAS